MSRMEGVQPAVTYSLTHSQTSTEKHTQHVNGEMRAR